MRNLIFLLLMVSTSLSAGSIQKWVDEDGNVHYGDKPPTATKTETVRVQSAPSDPGKALPRLNDGEQDQAASDEAAEPSEDQTEQACKKAQADLDIIENNTNIRLKQADGTVRELSPTEVQQRKTKANADIREFCN